MPEPPAEIRDLAERRAAARAQRDFATADALRDELATAGWVVVDEPGGGWHLDPAPAKEVPEGLSRVIPDEVPSLLDQPADLDFSIHWVCEGWPQDIDRAIAGFRSHLGNATVQFVVADVTGADPESWGEDVEVLTLAGGTGWGAARNAGLRRSRGEIVLVMDGSIEPAGNVLDPLASALEDPTVGLCGPFGIVSHDLRQFEETPGPECDAVEGYMMALRREILLGVGLFDEKFKWYRTADIEFSFRIRDNGLRALVIPVPVEKHEHRIWFNTDPRERAKWSKRNYYRFLERFRGRYDLLVDPRPPEGEA
jgi:cysteinyl-tRNA synthetase